MKRILLFSLAFLFCLSSVLAEEVELPEGGIPKTFRVSAYYSPEQGQSYYFTGSYEREIILNGNGTHAADGTAVYPGMLAAPKNYPFGTKIYLPGIGMGVVHDRGGAIVPAGQRGQSYDRIDVWMGSGEEGLQRALQWGKRTVDGVLYSAEVDVDPFVQFRHGMATLPTPTVQYCDSTCLSAQLALLGYAEHETLEENILAFQLAYNVIDDPWESGAGNFGPLTKKTLSSALSQRESEVLAARKHLLARLPRYIEDDGNAEQQELLQKILLSFLPEQKEHLSEALIAFQKEQGIIQQETDWGAGNFGPKTQAAVVELVEKRQEGKSPTLAVLDFVPDGASEKVSAPDTPTKLELATEDRVEVASF